MTRRPKVPPPPELTTREKVKEILRLQVDLLHARAERGRLLEKDDAQMLATLISASAELEAEVADESEDDDAEGTDTEELLAIARS